MMVLNIDELIISNGILLITNKWLIIDDFKLSTKSITDLNKFLTMFDK